MPDERDGRRPEPIPEELLRELHNILSLQRDAQETDRKILEEVEEIEGTVNGHSKLLQQILALVQSILDAVGSRVAATIAFEFSPISNKGDSTMPLSMPANTKNERYFIIGTDASGLTGAALATGQTVAVVSSDPNTVVLTPDATPGLDNEGVQSVASGSVAAGPTPVLNSAINVTATVTNADGTAGATATDTVTITPAVPGVAVSIGELFEAPISVTPAAAAKLRK